MTTLNPTPRRLSWLPQKWHWHIVLLLILFTVGFPMVYTLLLSTQTQAQILGRETILGTNLLDNYRTVIRRDIPLFMINSFFTSAVIAVSRTVLALLAGLAFVYFEFRGKWLLFGFILVTLMMPQETLMIALFRLISGRLDLANTYAALIVPSLASASGVLLFRQHFSTIPADLSEAAQMDGANPLQYLIYVLVPLSWNVIAAFAVIMFLNAWNQYLWPLIIIQNDARQVVQVWIANSAIRNSPSENEGALMLGAVIASIPPLVVFIAMQRHFMSGFAITRDK